MADLEQEYAQALQATADISQRQLARRNEFDKMKKDIHKTAFIGLGLIFLVAGISDLLSIADLGWLTAWLSSLLMYLFIVRRIEKIDDGSKRIQEKTRETEQELRRIMGPSTNVSQLEYPTIRSYLSTFIRDTIITQLIELIPILDWLPFYLGQFAKAYMNMRTRHIQAQKLLTQYEEILVELEQAENIQIQKITSQIYAQIDQTQLRFAA